MSKLFQAIDQILSSHFQDKSDFYKILDLHGDDRHFTITIKSDKFQSLTRVQRVQLVQNLLKSLLDSQILHAVQLNLTDHSQ